MNVYIFGAGLCIGYKSYIAIIKELSGNERSVKYYLTFPLL